MSIVLKIRAEPGLLRVVATGEFSLQEAERTFLEILDAVARHKSEKIFVDGRRIEGEPDAIERFLYGKFAANAVVSNIIRRGVSPAPQFAYVLHEPVLDPRRFGETAAVNRGMWVKMFDNCEDALRWLGVAAGDMPGNCDA